MKPDIADRRTSKTDIELRSDLTEATSFALASANASGALEYSNAAFDRLLKDAGVSGRRTMPELFASVDPARWQWLFGEAQVSGKVVSLERLGAKKDKALPVEISLQRFEKWGDARVAVAIQLAKEEFQKESLLLLQGEVLQAVAEGQPLNKAMDILCRRVETIAPELLCTVLLVDDQGRVHPCAAPSMPPVFSEAIDNEPIGPKAGSCGTAAWLGQPVEVTDIATDPLWEDYKALALPLGLAACWSTPIFIRSGGTTGTFALYYREKRGPSPFHRQLVETCVHICSLAIEHERAQQQIHDLVFYDSLTGLPNRNLLKDRAEQAIMVSRFANAPLTAMFIDLDNFKDINESLGHGVGDRLIQVISQRMQSNLPPKHTLARTSGDEFVVLLPGVTGNQARVVADTLLERIRGPVQIMEQELSISASIGISVAPDDAANVDALLRNTEFALHKAKDSGRNTFCFYQNDMNDAATLRHNQLAALRRAIAENALTLHFQPKVWVRERRLQGVEVLVRCHDPELGNIPPDVFIPLAEESGLINALDFAVLDQALAQLATWRRQGLNVPTIAVNLSALDFHNPTLVDRIRGLLTDHDIAGDSLTLEITEGLLIESDDAIMAAMKALCDQGIHLSIDDFGTGFSSLSYLKRFPVAELKVDRSFIRDVDSDVSDRRLTAAVIQLGGSFQLQVVAEGVETQLQYDIVAELGCDLVQGYFIARPMPASELEQWLAEEGRPYLQPLP